MVLWWVARSAELTVYAWASRSVEMKAELKVENSVSNLVGRWVGQRGVQKATMRVVKRVVKRVSYWGESLAVQTAAY